MEPLLEKVSAIIPDEKINRELILPQPSRGPRHQLKPSQMYRIHLLLCLKRLASFRQLREDLLHHRDWRSFARLKNKHSVPTLRALSEFRQRGAGLIRQINQLYHRMIFSIVPTPLVIVTVPDSTDIRAATKGYTKKTVLAPIPVNIPDPTQQKTPPKVIAPKNQDSRNGLSAIRNIRSAFSFSTHLPFGPSLL